MVEVLSYNKFIQTVRNLFIKLCIVFTNFQQIIKKSEKLAVIS